MDSIYQNPMFIDSTVASGNRTGVKESKRKQSSTWTKVLLIGLTVALGGLVFLGIQYVNVSVQLSAQETNAKIISRKLEELTANYTRITEHFNINGIMMKQLTNNFTRVKQRLSFYEGFTAQSSKCDVIFTAFNGKFYFFSCDKMTWSSSRDFCVSRGADLVSITSQEEQNFLYSKATDWNWIGLNDLETEGRWVWVNGQTLQDTGVKFWFQRQSGKSEPDNWKQDDPSGEHCVFVKNNFTSLNNWFDGSCKYKIKFICEKKY